MTSSPGYRPPGDGACAAHAAAPPSAPPDSRRAARRAVPRRAVLGVVLLALAVVTVLGGRVLLAGRSVAPRPLAPAVVGGAPPATGGSGLDPGAAGGAAA